MTALTLGRVTKRFDTGAILAAFTELELVLLGRLFRASLLATGQRPNLAEVIARMRGLRS